MQCKGYIDSIYHGSCVDGQGIRSVVFFSGCNLRCPFCHNPETLYLKGEEWELDDLVKKILRYKNYYKNGGVTLSGGEPFLQSEFATSLSKTLKELGVSVACETNGLIVGEKLIKTLDGVRLDIKNQNGEDKSALVKRYKPFIDACKKYGVNITITNVLCPGKNDGENSIKNLAEFLSEFGLIKNLEFLLFKKTCIEKYKELSIEFPYNLVPEADQKTLEKAKKVIKL